MSPDSVPITAWKWQLEAGGEIRILGTREAIHLIARSQFATAAPPVVLDAAEATQLIEVLRKMVAPMAKKKADA